MLDTLFGAEVPLAVKFFLAFLVVLGLILGFFWALRRFGGGRLGGGIARGRQPRLAVIDYASVDGRRRLILVRRDNVEHLLMTGGPTDVVVESNIVRAVAAPRDAGARPPAGIEALPRAIPLPEAGNGHGAAWPLQPEPVAPSRAAPRLEPLPDEMPRQESRQEPRQETRHEPARPELPRPLSSLAEPARPQRDTLAALADELSTRSPVAPRRPATSRPAPDETPADEHDEPAPQAARAEPVKSEAPRMDMPRPEPRKPAPPIGAPIAAPPPSALASTEAAAAPDQSLADMAQRLEAALRKPMGETRPQTGAPRPATEAERAEPTTPSMSPRMPRPAAPKPRTETKPNQGKATVYDSLEQEMASLLGRPTKT